MNETRVRGLYASVIKVARNDGGDDNVIVAQLGRDPGRMWAVVCHDYKPDKFCKLGQHQTKHMSIGSLHCPLGHVDGRKR